MLCGAAGWTLVLFWTCFEMLGTSGQPVDNREDNSTISLESGGSVKEERKETSAKNNSMKPLVRRSQSLSAAEKEFTLNRKKVSLKSLNNLGVKCSLNTLPHIAVLGSGGGQRAAVGLLGSLHQMEKDGLLDSVLYLGGVSGSAWSMSLLYSDPEWSKNLDRAVSKLSGPGISPEKALSWLDGVAKDEHFSLSDIWGLMTSAGIMNQLDLRRLSEDSMSGFNPYPVYNAVNKNCLKQGPEKGKWFEMTPHESGFTDLGLFVNTSHLSSIHHGSEMDMVRLQGIVGSNVADEQKMVDYLPDWLKDVSGAAATDENNLLDVVFLWTEAPQQVKSSWQVLDHYMRGYHSLLKITELIRKNTDDPAVKSDLDELQKIMRENMNLNPTAWFGKKSPEQRKLILEQWGQKMLEPLKNWTQSLKEGPVKDTVSLLVNKIFPLIGKWEWGTTENFLHKYPDAAVPPCVRQKEHLQLIDAGVMINVPFPPFLGEKRDVDLLIALDYGADKTFTTLTQARDYAAELKKPFPEIDEEVLEERDWPKDLYVFEGTEKAPTIVYMPLFNRNNCRDAEEVEAKMEEFATFQLPFGGKKMQFLLETVKENMRKNREVLLREINKAAERKRERRRSSNVKTLNFKQFTSRRP
ncbi:cytosolic phospholipase A2 gamma-like isoform X2 [Xyrichtys novacula]|uniref:Cytosolic phospholipase A2 gamma-like isoform X2 n=1 Tax=Xyrichtys novacula TaxID=13765 RepID=A0AAV1GSY8_XYRNO|nr:cytosolic phospholipase A2 gamma-like isoform X2 [Xyrichtys novacula]